MSLLECQLNCPTIFSQLEVFVDGGVRRGADILKCMCLGATAVGMGRPFLYAVNYGQEGVELHPPPGAQRGLDAPLERLAPEHAAHVLGLEAEHGPVAVGVGGQHGREHPTAVARGASGDGPRGQRMGLPPVTAMRAPET